VKGPGQGTEYLYWSRSAWVSASWVSFGKTSYAVHTITQLSLQEPRRSRVSLYALLLVSLLLVLYCVVQVRAQTFVPVIGWLFLLASLAIFVMAVGIAMTQLKRYRLILRLYDGSSAVFKTRKLHSATELQAAILLAVDLHRQGGRHSVADASLVATVAARRLSDRRLLSHR